MNSTEHAGKLSLDEIIRRSNTECTEYKCSTVSKVLYAVLQCTLPHEWYTVVLGQTLPYKYNKYQVPRSKYGSTVYSLNVGDIRWTDGHAYEKNPPIWIGILN